MSNSKWKHNSGLRNNRNVTTKKFHSDGHVVSSVTEVAGKPYNGYYLDIEGGNIVMGIGTSKPVSRLSLGDNYNITSYDSNNPGQLSKFALNETVNGGKFNGIYFDTQITKYNQRDNSTVSEGLVFMSSSLDTFSLNDNTAGKLYLTNENILTIGNTRKGIQQSSQTTSWRGIGNPSRTENDDSPNTKIVLDVRGSIKTDGYINFYNKYVDGGDQIYPDPTKWNITTDSFTPETDVPIGSLWLQPPGSGRIEGLYFKNFNGSIEPIFQVTDDFIGITSDNIYNFIPFLYGERAETKKHGFFTSQEIGQDDRNYIVVRGAGISESIENSVGGVKMNIRKKKESLETIINYGGLGEISDKKALFSVTGGNLSVTGLSGEVLQIIHLPQTGNNIHPIFNINNTNSDIQTYDSSGGVIWTERQLLIGSHKWKDNWAVIDAQTVPTAPAFMSYNSN